MVTGVFLEVLAKISPSTANANHHSLSMFSYEANEELNWRFASGARQMIKFDLGISWHS
jgi:hypothetical protein